MREFWIAASLLWLAGAGLRLTILAVPPVISLPALLGAQSDVARMSAAIFTISYSEALVISVLSGFAWDVAGSARFAFLPIALSAMPLLFMPLVIPFRRAVV
jgi:CP family cyanate transporter-like MFS transporter